MWLYWFTRFLCKILRFFYFPTMVYGRENFPSRGAFIIASNHLSNIDPPIISLLLFKQLSFIAKDTLFENKILAWFFRTTGTIPIKRETSDFRALRSAMRSLDKGRPLVIFPEGSRESVRKAANKGSKAYSGIGFLAAKSKIPVIPVKIIDSDKVMPVHVRKLTRFPVKVVVGKPLSFSDQDLYPQIAYRIMDAIASLSLP